MGIRKITGVVALALALLLPGWAAADEISGDWCSPEGASIRIQGGRVISPGGVEVAGQYSRHRYEFVIPEGESGAGSAFVMEQLSEDSARVTIGQDPSEPWTRCRDVVS